MMVLVMVVESGTIYRCDVAVTKDNDAFGYGDGSTRERRVMVCDSWSPSVPRGAYSLFLRRLSPRDAVPEIGRPTQHVSYSPLST